MRDLSLIKFYIPNDLDTISMESAKSKVIENGGIIREDITNDLWYIVANKSNSNDARFTKAKDLGVIILDEQQFLKMLENEQPKDDSSSFDEEYEPVEDERPKFEDFDEEYEPDDVWTHLDGFFDGEHHEDEYTERKDCDERGYDNPPFKNAKIFSWQKSSDIPLNEILETSFNCNTPMIYKVFLENDGIVPEKNNKEIIVVVAGVNSVWNEKDLLHSHYDSILQHLHKIVNKIDLYIHPTFIEEWDDNFDPMFIKNDVNQLNPSIYTWKDPRDIPLPSILKTALINDSRKIYKLETSGEEIKIVVGAKNIIDAKRFLSKQYKSLKISEWPFKKIH